MSDPTTPSPAESTLSRESTKSVDAGALTASMSAIGTANAQSISATGSAIATARTTTLTATGSALGLAQVDGDAEVSLSAVPFLVSRGDATFRQAYASAFIAGGDIAVSQGGAPLIVGKKVTIDSGGGAVLLAGKARVSRGWIGLLFAKDAEISDDSRVVLTTRGALIVAAALLGGFGLIAIGVYCGARKLARWKPDLRLWGR